MHEPACAMVAHRQFLSRANPDVPTRNPWTACRFKSNSRTLRFAYSMKEQTGEYSIAKSHMLKSISATVQVERCEEC